MKNTDPAHGYARYPQVNSEQSPQQQQTLNCSLA